MFAEMACSASRAEEATRKGADAFARLLHRSETGDSGQTSRIASCVAACYNGRVFQLDAFDLRAVDVAISDDMLASLDALRWGRSDLHTLVPDGDARVRAVLQRWGLCRAASHASGFDHRHTEAGGLAEVEA